MLWEPPRLLPMVPHIGNFMQTSLRTERLTPSNLHQIPQQTCYLCIGKLNMDIPPKKTLFVKGIFFPIWTKFCISIHQLLLYNIIF